VKEDTQPAANPEDSPVCEGEVAMHDLHLLLAERTELLQTTLNCISQGVLVIDSQGRVRAFNPRVCELLDLQHSLLASHPMVHEVTRFQRNRGDFGPNCELVEAGARELFVRGDNHDLPFHYLRKTLSGRMLEIKTQIPPCGGMVRTFTDVTEYVQAEDARQRLTQLLETTQAIARVGGWEIDLVNGSVYWTNEVFRLLDTSAEEFTPTQTSVTRFFTPEALAVVAASYADVVNQPQHHDFQVEMITAKGRHIWVHSIGTTQWEHGRPIKRIATVQDVTERKRSESLIWEQANFDALTGLPNRRLLRERLEQEIKKSRRDGLQLAILFIDLDHFKEVNDTLGHDSGDQLLIEATRRIKECLRDSDTVARMGGDEFTVILTEIFDVSSIERILQKLLRTLATTFRLGDEQVFVSASIGVTMYPFDATAIEDLFKNADQALYVAKGAGRNRFSFFTPALQEAAQTRVRLANDLRAGLVEKQFRVVYQPIIEMSTGAIHKAEALIRWDHPQRGLVSPAEFIPIAESSGLIVDIGQWVFQQAAAQVLLWRQSLNPDFQISINKSPVQFNRDGNANQPWSQQLQALGLPGQAIVVEITEGLLLDTTSSVADQLLDLRDAGIQMSLDDFGTGYSSLSYLQKFDIDFIKIDQSFVRHLIPNSTDLALCKAIIVMAHALGMRVIAEGVETMQQRDLLAEAGCDFGQGYLFSKPISAVEFEAFALGQPL
jgi:diguanylate cyclase (GGDEF)-like protein